MLVLLSVNVLGCSDPSVTSVRVAHRAGVQALRTELQTHAEQPEWQVHDIPKEAWPRTVREFEPIAVQRHGGGIIIVLRRAGSHQQALLVMLDPEKNPGIGGSGVGYEWLEEGLFWRWEKIRTPIPQMNNTVK